MLGCSQMISARAFREPGENRTQRLVRNETHLGWIHLPSAAVHFKKKGLFSALFICLPSLFSFSAHVWLFTKTLPTFQGLDLIFAIWCRWEISTEEEAGGRCRGITWEKRGSVGESIHCSISQHSAHPRKSRNWNSPSSSAAINTPDWFSWSRLVLAPKGGGNVQMSLWGSPLAFTGWVPAVFVSMQLLAQSENYTKCNYNK